MERSRAGCHLPIHTSHLVHVEAGGTQSYSATSDFSDCRCQNSLACQAGRSLQNLVQIILSFHEWSSKSVIIAFGQTKIPVKLEPQWSYGIWIGRDTSNGNRLTLTSEGLIKSRSVRRLTLSQRFNVAILRSAVGTSSGPSGRLQEYQDVFIGLPQLMSRYHTRPKPE
eukprot:343945-Amphidinium_carterae.1